MSHPSPGDVAAVRGGSWPEVHQTEGKGRRKHTIIIKNIERIFKPSALPGIGGRWEQGQQEWGVVVQHAHVAGTSRHSRAGVGKNNLFH